MKGFLYGQTEFNLLKNAIHLNYYIHQAKSHQFNFLSITDSNLYGAYKFYQLCKKNNIQPIIGLEITYMDEDNFDSKILAYAKNESGYKNLLKISTYLSTDEKPAGLDFLKEYRQELLFVSVFNESILERYYTSKSYSELNIKLEELNSYFEFYVGYSYTNRLDRLEVNQAFRTYANDRGIPTVPVENCRYLKEKDAIIYEALTKIGGVEHVVKDYEDYSFDDSPLASKELDSFIAKIKLDLYPKKYYLPKYPNTKGASAKDFLQGLCQKGLYRRLLGQVLPEYQQRLFYELSIIDKMGYNDYFLIVWDYILYAKKRNILVGPGRGTVAGSLVAYCLGITEIDPLKYNLWFERFLNPERVSMPDIDTDFPDNYRDEVIQYVQKVYGEKQVCSISTFNSFLLKSSIRDLGRIRKMDNDRQDELIRLVESSEDYDALLETYKERQDIYDFLYIIRGLEGLPRHVSTHAAGVIISSIPLDDIIPLQQGGNHLYQSQLEAVDLEQIGLLKMDFLGIRNLTIIDQIIHKIPNFDIDRLRKIPMNDFKTYQLLQRADTLGVFQLESEGIQKVLLNLKPETFEDIVAVLALYRPGPMENIDEFIARRHGKPFTYLHASLEPILKSTYGIIVYQEQIMQIAQVFAGFTLGEADILRRAVAKKKEEELLRLEESFLKRSIEHGYTLEVAKSIYQYILKFANYGFNKSHTVAYGMVAYQMAYLKANYFDIFISKILNNVIGATKTMVGYIQYAKTHQVLTFKPNINISSNIFEVTPKGMYLPLQAIHSIGETTALEIVKERENGPYTNYFEFKARTKVNVAVLEALIYAGALDDFGLTKKQMIDAKSQHDELIQRHLPDRIVDTSEYDFQFLQEKEAEYLGFNLEYDLFRNIKEYHQKYHANYIQHPMGRTIVSLERLKEIETKNKEKMLVGIMHDGRTMIDFVIFPSLYRVIPFQFKTGKLYQIEYSKNKDAKTNRDKLVIKNVIEC